MFWRKKEVAIEQPLTLPKTEQEKLDLLTPDGYSNMIVKCGKHTLYIVFDECVYFCYHDLKHVQLAFINDL